MRRVNTIDRKIKAAMFLLAYSMYFAIDTFFQFVGDNERAEFSTTSFPAMVMRRISPFVLVFFWGASFLMVISARRHKFLSSRGANILMFGTAAWVLWGVFANMTGLALFSNINAYKALAKYGMFYSIVFFSAMIAAAYDLKRELVGIAAAILGTALLVAFITHPEGFAGFEIFTKIFDPSERYRSAFGSRQFNFIGRMSLNFFMLMVIYKSLIDESNRPSRGGIALYVYFLALSPLMLVMMLSCASRASLTSLILFWLSYRFMGSYHKTKSSVKAMFVVLTISLLLILAVAVDWGALWEYFWRSRMGSYRNTLPRLVSKNVLLYGFGFIGEDLYEFMNSQADSYYVNIILQTGAIGFSLLVLPIFCFAFMYFRDISRMTKQQMLAGSLLIILLWCSNFERWLFYGGGLDLINWVILVWSMNEKSSLRRHELIPLKGAVTL